MSCGQALRGRSNVANADRYCLLLLRVCISVGVLLALDALRVSTTAFGFNAVTFAIAPVLMWSGVALRWWSFSTLGGLFTRTPGPA